MEEIEPVGSPLEQIQGMNPFDAIKQIGSDGVTEFWWARQLMKLVKYSNWQNFMAAIERAKIACTNAGMDPGDHFRSWVLTGASKNPSDQGGRPREDYALTRYACYLVVMNGDPRKPEIAAGQTYFAVKTREAELAQPSVPDITTADGVLAMAEILRKNAQDLVDAKAHIAEIEPAAAAWTELEAARGDYSMADVAKILDTDPSIQTGQNRLFKIMEGYGWVFRQKSDGCWRADQDQVKIGRLAHKMQHYEHPESGELIVAAPQVRVTVKGIRELHKRMGGTGDVDELIKEVD